MSGMKRPRRERPRYRRAAEQRDEGAPLVAVGIVTVFAITLSLALVVD
jgi:hypothetical protein